MLLRRTLVTLVLSSSLGVGACGSGDEDRTDEQTPTADADTGDLVRCADGRSREEGVLRVATDPAARAPWFVGAEPANGRGFESAVAHAVADQLGHAAVAVTWLDATTARAQQPGAKEYDFALGQVEIDDARARDVDFSDPYYAVPQAVVALEQSPAARVGESKDLDDLEKFVLGAVRGSAALTAIRRQVEPGVTPVALADEQAARKALVGGKVAALVVDLATALDMAESISDAQVVGQFQAAAEGPEFALVLEKGSTMTDCVNRAIAALRSDGTLATLEQKWLVEETGVPVLRD